MSDLNVNAAGVLATNANTTKAYGIAAGSINAGQAVWLDTSVSPNLLRLAQGTAQVQAQNVVGLALDSAAGSAQLLSYATAGDVTLPTSGAGSMLISGSVYVLSTANPGGIAPSLDPAPGTAIFISVLGVATSPTNLRLSLMPLGTLR